MKKAILTLVAAIAVTLGCAAQTSYVTSAKGNVNLRTAPSKTAAKAGTLKATDMLPCLDMLDDWYKVDLNGKEVYVASSVATVCDAVIPSEIFKKDLTSNSPLDKIRFQGSICIEPVDNGHVLITVNWMRVNLPAEATYYLADLKDGTITATHKGGMWVDPDSSIADITKEMSPLANPVRVGFDEFNTTIYFDGASYSEYQ